MVVVTMVDGQVDRVVDHVGYCTDFTFLFFFSFFLLAVFWFGLAGSSRSVGRNALMRFRKGLVG